MAAFRSFGRPAPPVRHSGLGGYCCARGCGGGRDLLFHGFGCRDIAEFIK